MASHPVFSATFISSRIHPLFHQRALPCTVASVHARACNVLLPDGHVIGLVHEALGPGPFHVGVEGHPDFYRYFKPGTQGIIHHGRLTFPGVTVLTHTATLWDPTVVWPRPRRDLHALANMLQSLLAAQPLPESTWARQVHRQLQAGVTHLVQALTTGSVEEADAAVSQLIGVGPGFTPAGDDALIGIMAGWQAFAAIGTRSLSVNTLATLVRRHGERTHFVSRAWLTMAATGAFENAWHRLAAALADESAALLRLALFRLRGRGATSGYYALLGFTAVVEALQPSLPARLATARENVRSRQ